MQFHEFKKRVNEVHPCTGGDESQEVLVRIRRGGRKLDHYIRIKYVCSGSLGIENRLYMQLVGEYFNPQQL